MLCQRQYVPTKKIDSSFIYIIKDLNIPLNLHDVKKLRLKIIMRKIEQFREALKFYIREISYVFLDKLSRRDY